MIWWMTRIKRNDANRLKMNALRETMSDAGLYLVSFCFSRACASSIGGF